MTRHEIIASLRSTDARTLAALAKKAREIRDTTVGRAVHLRGLVEFSNHCRRRCTYCGISCENGTISRYRMTEDDIVRCAEIISSHGIGTIVLQSGEDPFFTAELIASIVRRIKKSTPLAVTLSLGERPVEDLRAWRDAGADRYLLRFETSDRRLFESIHPSFSPDIPCRMKQLEALADLGFEVGSGIMTGLPGQTYRSVADDLLLFRSMSIDMIGIGPYVPHPGTPLANRFLPQGIPDQVPHGPDFALKTIALTRILCPPINMPCTTALRTLDESGYVRGLASGCNVIMPNVTPLEYAERYDIYPGKKRPQNFDEALRIVEEDIARAGCYLGKGAGESQRFMERKRDACP